MRKTVALIFLCALTAASTGFNLYDTEETPEEILAEEETPQEVPEEARTTRAPLAFIDEARLRESMLPFLLLLFLPLLARIECGQKCVDQLKYVELVPTYTQNIPYGDLKVVYDKGNRVKCGNSISIVNTTKSPVVTYDVRGKCRYMSIMMFDPDTPIPAPKNIFLHWFVSNIPARVIRKGYSSKQNYNGQCGLERAYYFPPAAPTGNHRYTFCVYCQNKFIRKTGDFNDLISRTGIHPKCLRKRNRFNTPEACNFFYLTAVNVKALNEAPVAKKIFDVKKKLGNTDKRPKL